MVVFLACPQVVVENGEEQFAEFGVVQVVLHDGFDLDFVVREVLQGFAFHTLDFIVERYVESWGGE